MSESEPAAAGVAARHGLPAATLRERWLDNEKSAIAERGAFAPPLLEREIPDLGAEEAAIAARGGAAPPRFDDGPDPSYAGLALSGGGIRSASLCLGVLQSLDRERLLGCFGWISTVSGGGYTGLGWLAQSWNRRRSSGAPGPGPTDFPFKLPEDPRGPLRHLRDHASYLMAPGFGPAMQAGGMLLRKLMVNLFMLAPVVLLLAALVGGLNLARHAIAGGWFAQLVPWLLLASLMAAAAYALYEEGKAGPSAPRTRLALDGIAGRVLGALLALFALLLLATALDWMSALQSWFGTILSKVLRDGMGGLSSLVTAIFGLLGAGTLAARLRGRFATLALAAIGVAFLFLILALAVRLWIDLAQLLHATGFWRRILLVLIFTASGAGLLWAAIRIVDANALSLHGYYRDRLAEAFFPPGAAPRLSELRPAQTDGPLPIVNATVAGATGPGMKRRGRPAGPFSFTPLEFGNSALEYHATRQLEAMQPECDAATAMAISAAAVAPQAGRVTGGRVAIFFKALLNARTARWLPSPRVANQGGPAPRADGRYAFREMLGGALRPAHARLVLVSDGGHWENLGVLALIHRHSPLILAIDAEADPDMAFNGLGIATMLSRLDAGTELRLDTGPLRPAKNRRSKAHLQFGRLIYPDGREGVLIYVKSTLTGDEPPDVLHYATRNPGCPHETTADQFFSEDQFEAYRALGEHIGEEVARALRSEFRRRGLVVAAPVP